MNYFNKSGSMEMAAKYDNIKEPLEDDILRKFMDKGGLSRND